MAEEKYECYENALAKCPFYHGETTVNIKCEGVANGSSTVLCFHSGDGKNRYVRKYCRNIWNWEACRMAHALDEKYK